MTVVTRSPVKRIAWALGALVAGCGGFRTVDAGDGGGGGGVDAATSMGGGTGPGPYGALPTGYCCASDQDCRYRNCVSFAGVSMCADSCDGDGSCNALPGFHCVGADQFNAGRCEPLTMGAACTPASQFHLGTKPLGACCTATHDGKGGLDCVGGLCYGFGDVSNPYICVNQCASLADCPGNYNCGPIDRGAVCAPLADPYTCN